MKFALYLALVFVALAFGACGGDDDATSPAVGDESAAIELALLAHGSDKEAVPLIGDEYVCDIPAGDLAPVNARCRWTAVPSTDQEGAWEVTFREVWLCEDFAVEADAFPPCNELTGFHEWTYLVDLRTNSAETLDEIGQFPPDYAQ